MNSSKYLTYFYTQSGNTSKLIYEVIIKLISKYVKDKTVKQKPIFCHYHSIYIYMCLNFAIYCSFHGKNLGPSFFC